MVSLWGRGTRIVAGAMILALAFSFPVAQLPLLMAPLPAAEPIPLYFEGRKMVAYLPWTEIQPDGTAITWIPQSMEDLYLQFSCLLPERDYEFQVQITVSGKPVFVADCRPPEVARASLHTAPVHRLRSWWLGENGVRVGEPAAVRIEILSASGAGHVPTIGMYGALLSQPATFAEYPRPSQPAALPTFALPPLPDHLIKRMHSSESRTATIQWPTTQALTVSAYAQAPGRLRLKVNGTRAFDFAFLSYSQDNYEEHRRIYFPVYEGAPDPAVGELVTITLEVEGLAGVWLVDIE